MMINLTGLRTHYIALKSLSRVIRFNLTILDCLTESKN